ncbi:MAG: hypothetical protein VB071_03255 [Lawsonibacter sp.]|nr:hypothetical protein [Lawsonibacter sp.]
MERNVDKIKRLEHELGRYQKKVADQGKELQTLQDALEEANVGNQQTQAAVDAVLTAVVLEHGVVAEDPDTGAAMGWRLEVPLFDVRVMRETYEIHARRDKTAGTYVLGVTKREERT